MIQLREAELKDLPILLEFEKKLIEYERGFTPNLKTSSFHYYDLRAYIQNPEVSVVVGEVFFARAVSREWRYDGDATCRSQNGKE